MPVLNTPYMFWRGAKTSGDEEFGGLIFGLVG